MVKAILTLADEEGNTELSSVVKYFLDYYKDRILNGLIPEKGDSVFASENCTYEDAEEVILRYPFERFSSFGALYLDSTSTIIKMNKAIWTKLTNNDKKQILKKCDQALDDYYNQIGD